MQIVCINSQHLMSHLVIEKLPIFTIMYYELFPQIHNTNRL